MNRFLVLAAVAVPLAGCGPVGQPSMSTPVPVTGKVTLTDGKPFGNVMIHFQPMDAPAPADGKVSADGSFTLTTYESKEGVCKGKYAVYFRSLLGKDEKQTNPILKGLPDKLRDETSAVSPIQIEITESGQVLDIKVDPKAK